MFTGPGSAHEADELMGLLATCVETAWSPVASESQRADAVAAFGLIHGAFFGLLHRQGPRPGSVEQLDAARRLVAASANAFHPNAPSALATILSRRYGLGSGHARALAAGSFWRCYANLPEGEVPERLRSALDALAEASRASSSLIASTKVEVMLEMLRLSEPKAAPEELPILVNELREDPLSQIPLELSQDQTVYAMRVALGYYEQFDRASRAMVWVAPAASSRVRHADLDALHEHQLELVQAFDDFCGTHHLRYYLSEGSILGAMRHGGFIPWDDDVDLMMPREDFTRFVKLALDGPGLPTGYHLDWFENKPQHWVFGAKLELSRPTDFQLPQLAKLATFTGPYVDIFPVDAVRRPEGALFAGQTFLLRALRRLLFMSSGRSRGLRSRPLLRIPLYLFSQVVPTPVVHRWVTWAQSRLNSSPDAAYWANLCSYYPLEREVFPKEWFGEGRRVAFENLSLPVPDRAEDMVAQIYGPSWGDVPTLKIRQSRSHGFVISRGDEGSPEPQVDAEDG